jgi:predicted RNA-binding protein YlxR (DUF448 family)
MCINCRDRFAQSKLIRLQSHKTDIGFKIVLFSGEGRSFYLCKECLSLEERKLNKALFRQCKSNKIEFNKQELNLMLQGENSRCQKK